MNADIAIPGHEISNIRQETQLRHTSKKVEPGYLIEFPFGSFATVGVGGK